MFENCIKMYMSFLFSPSWSAFPGLLAKFPNYLLNSGNLICTFTLKFQVINWFSESQGSRAFVKPIKLTGNKVSHNGEKERSASQFLEKLSQHLGVRKPTPNETDNLGLRKPTPNESDNLGVRKGAPNETDNLGMMKPAPNETEILEWRSRLQMKRRI